MTSTASLVSRNQSRAPRFGWRTLGAIAAATLGSGPVLVLGFSVVMSLMYPEGFMRNVVRDPAGFALTLAESMIYGSVVSLPATLVHAAAIGLLARRSRDKFGWSLASGIVLGVLLAGFVVWFLLLRDEAGGLELLESELSYVAAIAAPFSATGALMGLLYWRIAIRPRRRWRLFQERERAALLAME